MNPVPPAFLGRENFIVAELLLFSQKDLPYYNVFPQNEV
jgi:hypothetical protein